MKNSPELKLSNESHAALTSNSFFSGHHFKLVIEDMIILIMQINASNSTIVNGCC